MLSLHNNFSLNAALDSLDKSKTGLSVSQTRLSTGYRINSAMDDAAGLQLATRLSSQSHGMAVAMRNTQNVISMLQTADGLMDEVGTILTRMSDLAIMAADGAASQADRNALNDEYVGLSTQIFNITENATFGGNHLFRYIVAPPGPDGPGMMGSGPMTFQIGESADEKVTIDFRNGLGNLNVSLYYAVDNGHLFGEPVDGPGTELTTDTAANALIDKLAKASNDVSALRSQFGALGNRLESVYRNLSSMHTNADVVRGRITDVDIATETAEMTSRQMLMQSGTAMIKNSLNAVQLVKSLVE